MNWYRNLEGKRKLLIGGTWVICLAMLGVTARRNNVSFDSFWHLQAGLDWINHGLSPWSDHFSFTFNGEAIAGPPYLFQALLGWIVNGLGLESGFHIFLFVNFLLVFGLVTVFLRKLRSPVWVICLILPLVAVLLQFRAIVRPELITYSLCVIAILLYYRACKSVTLTTMWPILTLMLLWTNYHSSIFGYIIFFGLFVDAGLLHIRRKSPLAEWLRWLSWGLAIVAIGFLNPDLSHPLVQTLTFDSEWKTLIQEYESPLLYKGIAASYALIFVAAITVLMTLRSREIGLLVVTIILVYFAAQMARLVTPVGIIVLCVFAWIASTRGIRQVVSNSSGGLNQAFGAICLLAFVLSMGSGIRLARDYMNENLTSEAIFPQDVVNHMIENDRSGRIFNEYHIGGFLAYHLFDDSSVYIDGRTGILYTLDHYYHYLKARNDSEILRKEVEQYDISLVLLKNDPAIFGTVIETGLVELDFVGENYSLFSRDHPKLPILGKLMANPACWDEGMTIDLANEHAYSIWNMPQRSILLPLADITNQYALAEDKAGFVEGLGKENNWNEYSLRFAGYRALDQHLNQIAFELFSSIEPKQLSDYIAAGFAKTRMEEWQTAEEILDAATRIVWPTSDQSDLVILVSLLNTIKEKASITLIEEDYLQQLAVEVSNPLDVPATTGPVSEIFCSKD